MNTRRFVPFVALLLTVSCAPDFEAVSELQELRVLLVRSNPVEIQAGEELLLERFVHVPEGQTIVEEKWSFCPFTSGSFGGFQCASCELDLAPDASTGELRVNPIALAMTCPEAVKYLQRGATAAVPATAEGEGKQQDFVETMFRYQVSTDAGEDREAILRVPVWLLSKPEEENGHPQIVSVLLDGVSPDAEGRWPAVDLDSKHELQVMVDPDSLDDYLDGDGELRSEDAMTSFYATGGSFENERLIGTDLSLDWTAPDEEDELEEVQLYMVVRDLRGGQSLAGPFFITVTGGGTE